MPQPLPAVLQLISDHLDRSMQAEDHDLITHCVGGLKGVEERAQKTMVQADLPAELLVLMI